MEGKDFLSNVPTSSVLHIWSVLIVHFCFVSANLFIYAKTQKKTKHLGEPASAAQLIIFFFFCQQFPVACRIFETMLGTLRLISSLLFLFYNLYSVFSRPCTDIRVHRWCCEAFIHYFSCQRRRKHELTRIPEQLQNGEFTTFKLRTIVLRPHPLAPNSLSFSNCSERSSKPVRTVFCFFFCSVTVAFYIGVFSSSTYISSKRQRLIKLHSGECQEPHTYTHTDRLTEKHPLSRSLEL